MHAIHPRQRGATLIIALVLLLVITVLGISTMGSATLGLGMAGNLQYAETAFQMAETGIEVAINSGPFNDMEPTIIPETIVATTDGVEVGVFNSETAYQLCGGLAAGASLGIGEETYSSYHFQITSTGVSERGAQSVHTQDFSLMGPGCL
ncbi:MAG: hypothetical protein FJ197_02190 [Gammaproteobacteria bacterium]|nr:hypothetical protein [Gammaproteobacteria bacterium]